MDGRRFDAATRLLGKGGSRRAVLKGLLGLGSLAVANETIAVGQADAARRSTPTPKPVSCPGRQIWNGDECVCPGNLSKCGPDCCDDSAPKGTPDYSECCDNACCYGHCYGQELCCEWPRLFCSSANECCAEGATCCGALGCIELGDGQCCSDASCPPNSTCNLERFTCECDPGFIDCGSGCIKGTCCNNDTCAPDVCYHNDCCHPDTCAAFPGQCGDNFGDGCGGTIVCSCPAGVCYEGQCCTPKTCADYPNQCGSGFNDDCGGTFDCPCASGICYQNTCCQPKTCADFPGQCGMSFPDECGGTIACDCGEGQHCSNGVCVSDIYYCGPHDEPFCGDGNCALGVDGNYYMINGTATETGDDCMYCTSNDDCVQMWEYYHICLQIRSWTDNTGHDHCESCPAGGGGLCGRWYIPT